MNIGLNAFIFDLRGDKPSERFRDRVVMPALAASADSVAGARRGCRSTRCKCGSSDGKLNFAKMENVSKEVRIYSMAWKVFLPFAKVAQARCRERNRAQSDMNGGQQAKGGSSVESVSDRPKKWFIAESRGTRRGS
ncbi:hypothetical protein [Burkholderia thailandensis]|uniref:hypothetical protein n=1 Tax=Burkholderia thailandensis TaxID=57975 RepID=UPI0018AF85FD|nr:hypothetical protein [Burkholderia thailandensis]MCS6520736.1 hypothetical protein [Burkholderia thailandensis]